MKTKLKSKKSKPIKQTLVTSKSKHMQCLICTFTIIKETDRYLRVTDFNKGKQEAESFYHLSCWKSNNENKEGNQQLMANYTEVMNKLVDTIGAMSQDPEVQERINGQIKVVRI